VVEFTTVTPEIREPFYEALLQFWNQPWAPEAMREFLDWRYVRRVGGETLVAMSGNTCLGLVDMFLRPYRIGDGEVLVREPCDWFCRPESRGLGMRMMRFINQQKEPLLGVGLPDAAVAIRRRMNWIHLTDAHDFMLRLTVRRLAAAAVRRLKLGDGSITRLIPSGLYLRPPRSWAAHKLPGGEVRDLAPGSDDWAAIRSASVYELQPVFTPEYFDWLRSAPPSLGAVLGLTFHQEGRPVGFTISRIEPTLIGKKAKIIHLQAFVPKVETLRWMIAENISRAIELGAESAQCRSSCQVTNAALASLGFAPKRREAVMIGFGDRAVPKGATNVTFLRGDDAMIPSLIGT
jgi:hypothetical protein